MVVSIHTMIPHGVVSTIHYFVCRHFFAFFFPLRCSGTFPHRFLQTVLDLRAPVWAGSE